MGRVLTGGLLSVGRDDLERWWPLVGDAVGFFFMVMVSPWWESIRMIPFMMLCVCVGRRGR